MNKNEYKTYFEDVMIDNNIYRKLYALPKETLIKCFTEEDYERLRAEQDEEEAYKSELTPFVNNCEFTEKDAYDMIKYLNVLYERNVKVLPFKRSRNYPDDDASNARDQIRNLGIVELELVDTVVYGDVELGQGQGNELYTVVGKMPPDKNLSKSKKVWVKKLPDTYGRKVVRYYTDFRKYLKSLVATLKDSIWSTNDLLGVLTRKMNYIECFLSTGKKEPPKIKEKRKITHRRPVNVSFIIPKMLKKKDKQRLKKMLLSKEMIGAEDGQSITEEDQPELRDIVRREMNNLVKNKSLYLINVTESFDELCAQSFPRERKVLMFVRYMKNGLTLLPVFKHPRVKIPVPMRYIKGGEDVIVPVYNDDIEYTNLDGEMKKHYLVEHFEGQRTQKSRYYVEIRHGKTMSFTREGVNPESIVSLDYSEWKKTSVIEPSSYSENLYKLSLINQRVFDRVQKYLSFISEKDDSLFPVALIYAINQVERIGLHGNKVSKRSESGSKGRRVMTYLFTSKTTMSKVDPLKPSYYVQKRKIMVNNKEEYKDVRVILTDRAKYLMKNVLSVFPNYRRYDYELTGEYVNYMSLNDIVPSGEVDPKTGYEIIDESDVYETILRTNVSNKFTEEGLKEQKIKRNFEKIVLERRKVGEPFRLLDMFDINKFEIKNIYDLPNPYFD